MTAYGSQRSSLAIQAPYTVVYRFNDTIADENRRKFAGMLAKLDESVGKVVTALHEARMLNNCIIVFTTDNGGPAAGFDMNYASNWPLRGVRTSEECVLSLTNLGKPRVCGSQCHPPSEGDLETPWGPFRNQHWHTFILQYRFFFNRELRRLLCKDSDYYCYSFLSVVNV